MVVEQRFSFELVTHKCCSSLNNPLAFLREPQNLLGQPLINSYQPHVPFVGQNAASHLGLFCLHREISSKNEIKNKNHS